MFIASKWFLSLLYKITIYIYTLSISCFCFSVFSVSVVQFHWVICATVFLEASSCCIIMYLDCSMSLCLCLVWVAQKLIVILMVSRCIHGLISFTHCSVLFLKNNVSPPQKNFVLPDFHLVFKLPISSLNQLPCKWNQNRNSWSSSWNQIMN